jgi:hypothetical protein
MLQRRGLDPAAFEWGAVTVGARGTTARAAIPALIHTSTRFYFAFGGRGRGGDFLIYFSPDPRGHGWDPSETWSAVMGWFDTWLVNLQRELAEGDLWDRVGESSSGGPIPSAGVGLERLRPETDESPASNVAGGPPTSTQVVEGRSVEARDEEILELKPNIAGIGINLRALWRWLQAWWLTRPR